MTDKRLDRATGIFDTRDELEAAVREGTEAGLGVTYLGKKFKVSKATVGRILNPGTERKNKENREYGTNPLTPLLDSLWVVREQAA
jgi:hypothetical protein